jgi:hypothetical protein
MDIEVIIGYKGAKEAAWIEKVINNLSKRGLKPYILTLYYNNLRAI